VIVFRARTTTGTAAPMREPAKVGVQAGDTGQDDSLETDRAGTGQLI
jgi:hypothetical protein